MAKLQNFIVVLLVLTIVLSAVSVVFNLIIYKMAQDNSREIKQLSSNSLNLGLIVEGNNNSIGGENG
ncbi:MAG TPA: hypothetical protein VJH20_00440 [Candidatus Nanoarchaeia archaeon]|nr:hypothetical protein [Candidatus Nanoarchaeia archaeon]